MYSDRCELLSREARQWLNQFFEAWPQHPQELPYPASHPDPEQFPNGVVRFLQVQLLALQDSHMDLSVRSCYKGIEIVTPQRGSKPEYGSWGGELYLWRSAYGRS